MLGPALMKSAKGVAVSGEAGDTRLYLAGSSLASITTGSVVPYRRGVHFFMGSGEAKVGGTKIGDASASLKFNTTMVAANQQTAGLTAPDAPAIATGAADGNTGSYSVVITRIRIALGSESNGSLPSDVISVSDAKIRITFPAASGNDRWGVYVTFRGRGSTGPHYHLGDLDETNINASNVNTTFAVSASGRQVDLFWNDSQLSDDQPPTDFGVPPDGTHVCTLANLVIVLGSFPGNNVSAGVSPSVAGKIESFSAAATSFLNPYETLIGFTARPTDGELMLWTKNSLQALVLTGSSTFPVFTRAIWPQTGIQAPHGGAFAESTFYGYSGKAGPVRLGGSEPDTDFALPVYEFFRTENWDPATVVVGYDRERDCVVYMGNGTNGNLAIPFMRSLGVWSTPMTLPGTPQAAVTVDGVLKISIGGSIYNFETGSGGAWYLTPAWQDRPDTFDRKTVIRYRVQANTGSDQLTVDFLKDFSDTPVTGCTQTSSGSGERYAATKRINQKCKVYTLKCSGTGAGHQVNAAAFRMLHEPGVDD